MMTGITFEIILILLLLVANGVFAMSEIAIVAAKRSRLEQLAAGGNQGARAAVDLVSDPTQFLSTVQVGITLIGILAGAFGGAGLTQRLAATLGDIPAIARFSEAIAFSIVVGAITLLSVIIGELVPKRIGLNNPERIASLVARPMRGLSWLGGPIVRLLTKSTNALFKLLPFGDAGEQRVTEEDIRALLVQGTASGTIHEGERHIAERVLRMGDRPVNAIMTPRPDIDWIDINQSLETLPGHLKTAMRSRFLVCDRTLDRVVGVVSANDLLAVCLDGAEMNLHSHMQQPLFIPSSMPALRLLESFQAATVHVAVVLDEFGSVKGIVTLNDILQDLVAPQAGSASNDTGIVRRDDGSWLVDGTVTMEDLAGATGFLATAGSSTGTYRTLGGLVMTELQRIPKTGDHFAVDGFRFEVVDMDGRRIDMVLVSRLPKPAEDFVNL